MNRFTTIALVALLAIAALIVPASAQMEVIEVRSNVYNGTQAAATVTITPTEFAGFFYDIDDDIGSESMNLTTESDTSRTIPEGDLNYSTTIEQVEYEADFEVEEGATNNDSYPVLGLFAEKFVATNDDTPDELMKLLLDNDDKYTLRTGSALELPNGYELTAKQIDVEGDKVWMELSRDGEFIEDEVIDVIGGEATWTYDTDVGDTDDVIVFRALITDVFQGQVDSLAVVEGLYLVEYEDLLTIENDDEFGDLEVTEIADATITMESTGSVTLSKDDTVDIAEGLSFEVADDDDIRFYLMKEYTEPGTYEIRGEVATGAETWTPTNFAGFFYDLDDDIGAEELKIASLDDRTIPEGDLTYNTSIQQVEYEAVFEAEEGATNNDSYPVVGLFAEKFVATNDDTPDELMELLLDNDDKYTLRTGSALEMPNGYELTAKQIDVEGDKVWMELSKDGEFVEDEVIDVIGGEATWTYDTDVGDTDDVIVFRALITDVFQGQVDSLAVVEGLYLVEYEDLLTIETDDEFGELEVMEIADETISMESTGSVTLSKDDTVDIAEDMSFLVADDDDLRYYPFVEMTIAGDGVEAPEDEAPEDEAPEDEAPEDEAPEDEAPEDEAPEDEAPEEEPPVDNETGDEEPAPGFEAVFAVAGLLAVAYLVRRN
ncbi:S-layer protein domain-containing protein [Methanolobus sp. ZRKC2]|uniref:S-layer protein domain-containing protein n=1 Tax=Methanolobus sp. ZRKC2 TaxID=3125783 RepID=UPI003245346C